jgi:hypothetical protein
MSNEILSPLDAERMHDDVCSQETRDAAEGFRERIRASMARGIDGIASGFWKGDRRAHASKAAFEALAEELRSVGWHARVRHQVITRVNEGGGRGQYETWILEWRRPWG